MTIVMGERLISASHFLLFVVIIENYISKKLLYINLKDIEKYTEKNIGLKINEPKDFDYVNQNSQVKL